MNEMVYFKQSIEISIKYKKKKKSKKQPQRNFGAKKYNY